MLANINHGSSKGPLCFEPKWRPRQARSRHDNLNDREAAHFSCLLNEDPRVWLMGKTLVYWWYHFGSKMLQMSIGVTFHQAPMFQLEDLEVPKDHWMFCWIQSLNATRQPLEALQTSRIRPWEKSFPKPGTYFCQSWTGSQGSSYG